MIQGPDQQIRYVKIKTMLAIQIIKKPVENVSSSAPIWRACAVSVEPC